MTHLLSKWIRGVLPPSKIRFLSTANSTSLARFSSQSNESRGKSKFTFKQGSSKPISKEAIYGIGLGVGFLGSVLGLNLYLRLWENRFADSSYHPVYENKPSFISKNSHLSGSTDVVPSADPPVRLPLRMKYIIIGAGPAGISAARTIRASDPLALVLLISGDTSCGEEKIETEDGDTYPPPYKRPVLNYGLWRRTPERRQAMLDPRGDIFNNSWFYYEPLSFFVEPEKLAEAEDGGVCLLRGNPVVALHPKRHTITLADGQEVQYECCLLATGVRPRTVPELGRCSQSAIDLVASKRVTYFRNIADYKHLQSLSDRLHEKGGRIAVLGSNQLSCELASSLLHKCHLGTEQEETNPLIGTAQVEVHQFLGFGVSGPMKEVLPPVLSQALFDYESKNGVFLHPSASVVRASLVDATNPLESPVRLTIHRHEEGEVLKEEEDIIVDHIVCAVGDEPRTELSASCGLKLDSVNGGFLVDADLESQADIFAAGGAASYWDPVLECRRRIDHLSIAEDTGELAGLKMALNASAPSLEDEAKLKNAYITPDQVYDPLPSARKHRSAQWLNIGEGAQFYCVGLVDSSLITRTVFLEGEDSAVVFYLRPDDNRLMGVLLWNLADDLFDVTEYVVPSRINLALSMLEDRLTLKEDADVLNCARKFNLSGEVVEGYEELKAFLEARATEEETKSAISPTEKEVSQVPVEIEIKSIDTDKLEDKAL